MMPFVIIILGGILILFGGVALYFFVGMWLGGYEYYATFEDVIHYGVSLGLIPLLGGVLMVARGLRIRRDKNRSSAPYADDAIGSAQQ